MVLEPSYSREEMEKVLKSLDKKQRRIYNRTKIEKEDVLEAILAERKKGVCYCYLFFILTRYILTINQNLTEIC